MGVWSTGVIAGLLESAKTHRENIRYQWEVDGGTEIEYWENDGLFDRWGLPCRTWESARGEIKRNTKKCDHEKMCKHLLTNSSIPGVEETEDPWTSNRSSRLLCEEIYSGYHSSRKWRPYSKMFTWVGTILRRPWRPSLNNTIYRSNLDECWSVVCSEKTSLLIISLLQWYLSHGLRMTKIHQVIEYESRRCFEGAGRKVAEARRAGDSDPSKSIYFRHGKINGKFSQREDSDQKRKIHQGEIFQRYNADPTTRSNFHSLFIPEH